MPEAGESSPEPRRRQPNKLPEIRDALQDQLQSAALDLLVRFHDDSDEAGRLVDLELDVSSRGFFVRREAALGIAAHLLDSGQDLRPRYPAAYEFAQLAFPPDEPIAEVIPIERKRQP